MNENLRLMGFPGGFLDDIEEVNEDEAHALIGDSMNVVTLEKLSGGRWPPRQPMIQDGRLVLRDEEREELPQCQHEQVQTRLRLQAFSKSGMPRMIKVEKVEETVVSQILHDATTHGDLTLHGCGEKLTTNFPPPRMMQTMWKIPILYEEFLGRIPDPHIDEWRRRNSTPESCRSDCVGSVDRNLDGTV